VVNPSSTYQKIDGFGAADVWAGPLTTEQATLLFDPANGIGLSLLHIGIETTGQPMGSGAVSDAQAASAFGVKVWATSWSPPASDKGNNNVYCTDSSTAHLIPGNYDAWASTLAAFPATFKELSGVQLYAISAQSEPDSCAPTHESCLYSAIELVNFAKVLGPKLAALNPPVKLIAPETATWSNLWSGDNYGNAILNDSAASDAVDILGTHDVGDGGLSRPSPPAGNKHPVWETSVFDGSGPAPDIGAGISIAQSIYAALTSGGASAWHYWWLVTLGNDGEGLLLQNGDTSNPPKRLYTVGNFSKFVRPGYVRVDVSGAVPSGVQLVAFLNPADGTEVIVAINSGTSAVSVSLLVSGAAWPSQVTPWVTAASANLASQAAISLSGARFSAILAGQSVTTFVGMP
jgi:glucuronoarabinoxylan endo-1,4-beta-xylanase